MGIAEDGQGAEERRRMDDPAGGRQETAAKVGSRGGERGGGETRNLEELDGSVVGVESLLEHLACETD